MHRQCLRLPALSSNSDIGDTHSELPQPLQSRLQLRAHQADLNRP